MEYEMINSNNKSFWHLVAENDLYEMVVKSGYGEKEFILFQKRRLKGSLLATLGAVVPAILISKWMAALAILFFVITWRNYYKKEKDEFREMVYYKELSWSVFERLLSSHLTGKDDSLYDELHKVIDRTESGEFKTNLHRLIIDITDDPKSVQPFLRFAQNAAGGSDASLTFMTALYNYKNHSADKSIVDELSDMARRDLMRGIHGVRIIKEKRFYLFPTKLTMANVIPMFGFMLSVGYHVLINNMNI